MTIARRELVDPETKPYETRVRYYGAYATRRRLWWRRRGDVPEGTRGGSVMGSAQTPAMAPANDWPALRARRRRWAESDHGRTRRRDAERRRPNPLPRDGRARQEHSGTRGGARLERMLNASRPCMTNASPGDETAAYANTQDALTGRHGVFFPAFLHAGRPSIIWRAIWSATVSSRP